MLTKDKLVSLTKYLEHLKDRLKAPTPPKHANHPDTFRNFLNNEISIVTKQLDAAKLDGVK